MNAAEDVAILGTAMSLPSKDGSGEGAAAFFAIALGSNFPAYGAGVVVVVGGVVEASGVATFWANAVFLSISSSMFLGPPDAASSFSFRSRSAATFSFQA